MKEALRAALDLNDTANDVVDEGWDVEAIGSILHYRYDFICPSDYISAEGTSEQWVA